MRFYYIWAKLFSFELKNTKKKKKIEIRNMNLKNAIKMINIQKYYSVHIGLIMSMLVHSTHFGSIWSTLNLFNPIYPHGPI